MKGTAPLAAPRGAARSPDRGGGPTGREGGSPPRPLHPGRVGVWLLAARPRTLSAAVAPVLVGTALAARDDAFAPLPAAAALTASVLIQVGTNLANDYADARRGADAGRVGPLRVTQAGLVTHAEMRRAIFLVFAAAVACGAYLIGVGGWPILLIGAASILSGLAYTGGPAPIAYLGLGDLFVFVFFGLVAVAGTHYVQAGVWSPLALAVAVPIGLLSDAILVVNNLRDEESDRRAGKRTLVARFGARFGRAHYLALLGAAYAVPPVLVASGALQPAGLLPLASLPIAIGVAQAVVRGHTLTDSLRALSGTSRLLLFYAILLCLGMLL